MQLCQHLCLGLILLFAIIPAALGQSNSPDGRWKIGITENEVTDPSSPYKGYKNHSVVIYNSALNKSQMLFDNGGENQWGPDQWDVDHVKWSLDCHAFTFPRHGKRFGGFEVYALISEKWQVGGFDGKYSELARKAWNESTEDWSLCTRTLSMTPLAWGKGSVLKWNFAATGYETLISSELILTNGNFVMKTISAENNSQKRQSSH